MIFPASYKHETPPEFRTNCSPGQPIPNNVTSLSKCQPIALSVRQYTTRWPSIITACTARTLIAFLLHAGQTEDVGKLLD